MDCFRIREPDAPDLDDAGAADSPGDIQEVTQRTFIFFCCYNSFKRHQRDKHKNRYNRILNQQSMSISKIGIFKIYNDRNDYNKINILIV